jgi:hypothetical protein
MKTETKETNPTNKLGYYSSLFLAIIALVTFVLAMTAVPISGALCPENCIKYPYLDSLSHFPKDYYWMFLAMPMLLAYLIHILSIHSGAHVQTKIYSRIGSVFAAISAGILLLCYYIQVSVVPVSLVNGETDGIALITQYNPNGIFIALEELGYLMMSFSFLFIAPVFTGKQRLGKFIRWIYIVAFILAIISLVYIVARFGIRKDYRFEVTIISINWLALIINGILTAVFFKRTRREYMGS